MPTPMSILNEKTAVELTRLFLERFQSIEAQNGPLATDVRFPLVKLTFVSPQNWIFNGNWTPMGGVTLRPPKGSSQEPPFSLGKSELLMVLKGALRAQGGSSKVI